MNNKKTTAKLVYGDFENHHWSVITDETLPRLRCDEALPLGNALFGTLIWMRGDQLIFSLDRGDLWDERRPTAESDERYNWQGMCKLIKDGDLMTLRKLFTKNPDEPYPTRLPGARLTMPWPQEGSRFELDMVNARAVVTASDGRKLEIFVPADGNAAVRWKLTGGTVENIVLSMAAFEEATDPGIAKLGYPECSKRALENGSIVAVENSDRSLGYAAAFACRKQDDFIEGAAVITASDNMQKALDLVEGELCDAWRVDFNTAMQSHKKWWQEFYQHSNVYFEDPMLDKAYRQSRYFFGSNARKDRPAVALQGIWTMDDGKLPPWRGDYHNNLNTQFTYLSYLAANDLDGGKEFLEFMYRLLPVHEALAKNFYGIKKGAVIPGAMTRCGNFMPAAVQYTYHPDNGMWVAWMFYRHWLYTYDREFLQTRAYPYAKSVADGALELASLDENGKFRFAWHASPEIYDSEMEAFFDEMTSYVNCSMYALFSALDKMASELGLVEEAAFYRQQLEHCSKPAEMTAEFNYYLYEKTVLGIQHNTSAPHSHRHLVQLMGFYPYDLIDIEHDDSARQLVADTLNQLDFFGPGQWVGFSWPWAAMMEMRMGNGAKAVRYLKNFFDGFCTINGFHVNGDFKDLGYTAYKYRPFTLETNFEAQEALHELLVHQTCGVVKFFPAGAVLKNAGFSNLRLPGAFLVSGELKNGKAENLQVFSEAGKPFTFGNAEEKTWRITGSDNSCVTSSAEEITFNTVAGAAYKLEMAE